MCTVYYENKRKYPPQLKSDVEKAIKYVEKETGMVFGDKNNPLLFPSVAARANPCPV